MRCAELRAALRYDTRRNSLELATQRTRNAAQRVWKGRSNRERRCFVSEGAVQQSSATT